MRHLPALPNARFERSNGHRTSVVLLHEPAAAAHIGRESGGRQAVDAFFGHMLLLRLKTPVQPNVVAPSWEVYRGRIPRWVSAYRE